MLRDNANEGVTLASLVADINRPHWCIKDSRRIDAALTALILRSSNVAEPLLWRGILRRISGAAAARADLETVLAADPGNRLATLNLAALPITCLDARLERGRVEACLAMTEGYSATRPDDYFAQLIKATLDFLAGSTSSKLMAALEGLYVRFPNYPPTPSLMAALQQKNGLRASASDFAHEALRLNPHDAVAHNILEVNAQAENPKHRVKMRRFSQAITATGFDVVFMAPYAQQDVDAAIGNY